MAFYSTTNGTGLATNPAGRQGRQKIQGRGKGVRAGPGRDLSGPASDKRHAQAPFPSRTFVSSQWEVAFLLFRLRNVARSRSLLNRKFEVFRNVIASLRLNPDYANARNRENRGGGQNQEGRNRQNTGINKQDNKLCRTGPF